MKFSFISNDSQQSTISMLIGMSIILGFMYWARVIVIPVALSILITFLLIPAVKWLEDIKIPRVPAVVLVTIVALSIFWGHPTLSRSRSIRWWILILSMKKILKQKFLSSMKMDGIA
ncbi:MAG TPA: hypothetical protein PLB54_08565 [Nitrosomonas sp.]|nr:hypothetical protein [Nitrosomonas sp.]